MSITNGIIQASPRLQADIMTALGLTSPQLAYICGNSHGKINAASKRKPTRVPMAVCRSGAGLNDLVDIGGGYKQWQGTDGLCGFSIPSVNLAITTDNLDPIWTYLAPRGGASEPYRMGDFIGYYNGATWDWGLPAVTAKVTLGGALRIGFNMMTVNDSNLCYGDIFNRTNSGIYVNVYKSGTSGNDGFSKKADIDWATGKTTVEYSAAEINNMGLSAGGQFYVHLYGLLNGAFVSLRNHESTVTLFTSRVYSSEPYKLDMQGELLRMSGTNDYYIYNLAARVNAGYYSGGTLAAGSVVKIFRYVTGTAVGNYNSLYSPLYTSGTLGAVTVNSGEIKYALQMGGTTKFTNYSDITSAVAIWYAANGTVLASRNMNVRTVTSI